MGGEIKGAFLKNKGKGGNVEKSFASILGKIHTGLNKRKKNEGFGNKMAPQHDLHARATLCFGV